MAVTLLQVVNRVRRSVGLNSDVTSFADTDESNDNVQDVNEAYEELLMTIPNNTPYLNSSSTISAVASTRLYSLASDCMVYDLYDFSFENETQNDAPMRLVTKEEVQKIDSRYDEVTGVPYLVYAEGNNQVGLYPVPDGSYTINYQYGQTPSSRLSSTSATFVVPDRWVRFIEKKAQEKYERRKAYSDPDNTKLEALELLSEILADAWAVNPTHLEAEGF